MLTPKQQAFELLQKSENILIPLPLSLSADALGSSLALALFLIQIGKKVELVSQDIVPPKLAFLPGAEEIKTEPTSWRDFIISIDTSEKKIKQLRYETKDSVLKIYLGGPDRLEQKDIRLEPGPFVYDLIIAIDAPDLEHFGPIYEKYSELFFEKPILNIDHKSANEHFGEVNLIEPTASSSAEIVADLINSFFPNQITPEVSTCLLAGIIDETHSFQKPNVTPQTFSLASLLASRGAEKEKIVQNLYKTKPLAYLRLWGRILARLKYQTDKNLAWAEAFAPDFLETQTTSDELEAISEEIHDMLPNLNASVIISQENNEITFLIQSARIDLLQSLNLELNGALKNHQLKIKTADTDVNETKSLIERLLN